MDRREFIGIVGVSVSTVHAGCLGDGSVRGLEGLLGDDAIPPPEDDEFPRTAGDFERGGGDTAVRADVRRLPRTYEEDPNLCGATAMDAVSEHVDEAIEDVLDDPRHISVGWGPDVPGVDRKPVIVTFVKREFVDGELVRATVTDLDDVVAVVPPTAYLTDRDDEVVCRTPVYVRFREERRGSVD